MFGKVKKWLGIEGVKVELVLPEMAFEEVGAISGQLVFHSKNAQIVTSVTLKMMEKYSRGRGQERLVDEYTLGEITLRQRIEVPVDEPIAVGFTLPFKLQKSNVDEFGEKNILTGGLVSLARKLQAVQSEFRIEAEADVEGTALNPFDKKNIKLVKR
ncbi:MAG: sporulation protein [Saprospiraceae bacterium]|nr:sporulation protein [Saprospiraceae bacterium]